MNTLKFTSKPEIKPEKRETKSLIVRVKEAGGGLEHQSYGISGVQFIKYLSSEVILGQQMLEEMIRGPQFMDPQLRSLLVFPITKVNIIGEGTVL
jgi:hypothetical protein